MSMVSEDQVPVYEEMFKSLLQTPHRLVDETVAVHREQFERDPNFYGHLASYAVEGAHCVVRDTNEVFVAILLASPYKPHQEAGYVMFQSLPPQQAARVARCYTGYDEEVKRHSYEVVLPGANQEKFGLSYESAKFSKNHPDPTKRGKVKPKRTIALGRNSKLRTELVRKGKIGHNVREITVETFIAHHKCLNQRTFKGVLRSAAKSYLKRRELNEKMMIGALLRNRKHIKQFYVRTNTLPQNDENGWINQYLWKGTAPDGSRLAGLNALQKETDPTKQAEIIVDNNLPLQLITSSIGNMTPSIMTAMVIVMTAQELLNWTDWLRKHGAYDNEALKNLIQTKLKDAKTAKRVDALKGAQVAKVVEGLDEETRDLIKSISDTQLKKHGNIGRKTLFAIDKSGSMQDAIELGKQLAASAAQACREEVAPIVYLFDNMATPIDWNTDDGDITTKTAWDDKLEMVTAGGGTSPAQIIKAMELRKLDIEQIVLVTDEGELAPETAKNNFANELSKYNESRGTEINVIIARIGRHSCDRMERSLKKVGINVDVLICKDVDSVSIPNFIQLLSKPSIFELVQEILNTPLSKRSTWDEKYLTAVVN